MTDGASRKITLEDVARAAGVSRALVSIVVRDAPGASQETRARVKAIVAELGYRPDARARLLARSRPRLLGVTYLVPALHHADLLAPIHDAADGAGYEVILGGRTRSHPEHRALSAIVGYRPDAVVMIAPELTEQELSRVAESMPLVVVGQRLVHRTTLVDVVRTDEEDGLRQAVEHLAGLGHIRIAHVDGGPQQGTISADRRRAYIAQMTRLGLREHVSVATGGNTGEEGGAAATRLLAERERPTAIVAYNDEAAWGVIRAATKAGLRVPEDLSVMGYDGGRLARMAPQALTTIHQDSEAIGRIAVTRAIARIETNAPVEDIVLAPSFMDGETTAPPRKD